MTCPSCGGSNVHRSRTRAFNERLRTYLTSRRPHRCVVCGWRGWLAPADSRPHHAHAIVTCEPLDLRVVDATLDRAGRRRARPAMDVDLPDDRTAGLDAAQARVRS